MNQADPISDKLKRLGLQLGAKELKQSSPRTTYPVEDVIPGKFVDTASGSIYLVENNYPLDHFHGITNLELSGSLNVISEWAGHPEISNYEAEDIVFLDTETSGLAGGTGSFAFMIGLGRYHNDAFRVGQFFMGDPIDEPALLIALEEYISPCKVLVTYNGKSFDVPLLNTRYIMQGWRSPFLEFMQIDLLHLARRLWRYRLPSRSLGDIETQILKAFRTEEEVPGWMIPQMYFDYLLSRDARPMQRVFYHNEIDVLSMAALLNHSYQLIEHSHEQYVQPIDRYSIARLYEDLGYANKAINFYKECMQMDIPQDLHLDAVYHLSFIYKRQEDYLQAIELWEFAASQDQVYAFVELAKYYEHTSRDYERAMDWTESAINLVNSPHFQGHQRNLWLSELEYRLNRLSNKIK